MSDLHDIPAVLQSVPSDIRVPLTRLIEGYRALAGFTRDPYARALTVRDAQAGGVTVLPGVTVPIGGGTTVVEEEPDLTPPPTVTGLGIVAGFSYVTVSWDPPSYTEGRGHQQTNIYAVKREAGDPLPTFAGAQKVYSAPGPLTLAALPSEMNTIWHVWAKWETVDNVESTSPAGGVNGATDTTGQDVSQLLDVLTGQITASELHASLGTRIDLIDASAAVAGSVNQRIGAVQDQVNSLLDTPAYDNATTYSADAVVTYGGSLYRALGTTTGNLPTNATYWQKIGDYASLSAAVAAHSVSLSDHETRITGAEGNITAEASSRSALAAQIRGAYSGTDPTALSTGLLYNERQARVSAESAIVSSVTALSATVTSNYTTLNAAITGEATSRATAVSAEATTRQALSTKLTGLADPSAATLGGLSSGLLFDERSARTTADGTLTTAVNSVSARLNSGGDIANAIVTVQTSASTANTAAGAAQGTANTALTNAASVATQLTTLQSSINSAGGNLLPNSSFEADPSADGLAAGWGLYANNETTTASTVAGRLGGLAQRIAWPGTNTGVKGVYTDSGIAEGGIGGGLRGGWQPNKTYVVSWWAYGSAGAGGQGMGLQWNVAPAATVTLSSPGLGTGWQRWAYRVTTGATVEANGRLYISLFNAAPATGHITIDDVMVQEGDLLTGYVRGDEAPLIVSLQQETTTRASQTGALFAQWTVKIDSNGYVSGFGLASTANNAAPTSSFVVRADSFAISSPTGPSITPATPFVVRTTPTTENGVSVPVGVYMDAAYIVNVSALYARFGTLVADTIHATNLDAARLTLGDGTVGGNLKSTTFTSGSAGWRLQPNGVAEFANIIARGSIYAQAADIQGTLVASQINGTGLRIYRTSDGGIVLNADDVSPPWVTAGGLYGSNLLAVQTDQNTRRLRNLLGGAGLDIAISADDQNLTLSALASEVNHKRLHSNRVSTSVTQIDASGFALALEANTVYTIRGLLKYTTAATTTGFALGITVPASAATILVANTATSGAGATETRVIDLPSGGSGSAIFSAAPPSVSALMFEASVTVGATPGNFQIRYASEVGGSQVTLMAGSSIFAHKLVNATTSVTVNLASSTMSPNYFVDYTTLGSGGATANVTIVFRRDGTWQVQASGIASGGFSSSYVTSGNWGNPTDADAGAQWEIQYVQGALTQSGNGSASVVNDAASYTAMTSDRSIRLTSSVIGPTRLKRASTPVQINLRRVADGAVTVFASVGLGANADAEN